MIASAFKKKHNWAKTATLGLSLAGRIQRLTDLNSILKRRKYSLLASLRKFGFIQYLKNPKNSTNKPQTA